MTSFNFKYFLKGPVLNSATLGVGLQYLNWGWGTQFSPQHLLSFPCSSSSFPSCTKFLTHKFGEWGELRKKTICAYLKLVWTFSTLPRPGTVQHPIPPNRVKVCQFLGVLLDVVATLSSCSVLKALCSISKNSQLNSILFLLKPFLWSRQPICTDRSQFHTSFLWSEGHYVH